MEEKRPRVSVIIPHHNGFEIIKNCVKSLLLTDYPNFEIIVVNDQSKDDSPYELSKEFPDVQIFTTDQNVGFGASCNLGAKAASGDIFVFLNNDTVVNPKWLTELVETMTIKDAQIATPKILFTKSDKVINAAGGSCDVFGIGWNRGNGDIDVGQYENPEKVFYGSACLAITKQVWSELEGYDESYFMYVEDVDLCWRAKLLGYDTYYASNSVISHVWRESTKDPQYILAHVFRNNFTTILKNYSFLTLILILPVYLVMKGLELVYFLSRSKKLFASMLSGMLWNIRSLSKIFTKRRKIQSSRKVRDRVVIKQMVGTAFEINIITGKIKHPIMELMTSRKTEGMDKTENA